jgi:hypothetical protein
MLVVYDVERQRVGFADADCDALAGGGGERSGGGGGAQPPAARRESAAPRADGASARGGMERGPKLLPAAKPAAGGRRR